MRKLSLTFAEDEIDVYRFLKSKRNMGKVVTEAVRFYLAAKTKKPVQEEKKESVSVDEYILSKEGEIINKIKQQILAELRLDPLLYWDKRLDKEEKEQENIKELNFGIDENMAAAVLNSDTSSLSGGLDVFDDDD